MRVNIDDSDYPVGMFADELEPGTVFLNEDNEVLMVCSPVKSSEKFCVDCRNGNLYQFQGISVKRILYEATLYTQI